MLNVIDAYPVQKILWPVAYQKYGSVSVETQNNLI